MSKTTKATHKGTCQICGRVQLLPSGRLSKHGYTTRWGFFSGVCDGSEQLPFEKSKRRIAAVMEMQQKKVQELVAKVEDLENFNSEVNGKSEAWVTWYNRMTGQMIGVVRPIVFALKSLGEGGCNYGVAVAILPDGKEKQIEVYGRSFEFLSLRHFVHHLNSRQAKSLRQQISSIRGWIKWQEDRCATWQPDQPLIAIS